jgi:hypothetical protein
VAGGLSHRHQQHMVDGLGQGRSLATGYQHTFVLKHDILIKYAVKSFCFKFLLVI